VQATITHADKGYNINLGVEVVGQMQQRMLAQMSIDERYVYTSVNRYFHQNFQAVDFGTLAQIVQDIMTSNAIPYKMVANVDFVTRYRSNQ